MTTAVEQRPQQQTLPQQIEAAAPQLARLGVDGQRFARVLLTEARRNPELLECEPTSVLGAALLAAQLRLEPGSTEGHVWLIPRKNKGKLECQFMLGYRGEIVLGERAGWRIIPKLIYSKDEFRYVEQPEPEIHHIPDWQDPGNLIGAYAVAHPVDGVGPKIIVVLNLDDIEERRKQSDAGKKNVGPWKTHYPQMARKSAVRAIWPLIPASSADLDAAHRADETVVSPQHIETIRGDEQPRAGAITAGNQDTQEGDRASTRKDTEGDATSSGDGSDGQDVGRASGEPGPRTAAQEGQAPAPESQGGPDAEPTPTGTAAAGTDDGPSQPAAESEPLPVGERPANAQQIKAIHTLAHKVGIIAGDDTGAYREELHTRYEVTSSKNLTVAQAGHFIEWLQEQLDAVEGTS